MMYIFFENHVESAKEQLGRDPNKYLLNWKLMTGNQYLNGNMKIQTK